MPLTFLHLTVENLSSSFPFILFPCLRNYQVPIWQRPHSHPQYPQGLALFLLPEQLPRAPLWNRKVWCRILENVKFRLYFTLVQRRCCALSKHNLHCLCIMHEHCGPAWPSLYEQRKHALFQWQETTLVLIYIYRYIYIYIYIHKQTLLLLLLQCLLLILILHINSQIIIKKKRKIIIA